ncbi:MAG: hypothetical protein FWD50_03890 [Betaproteobacteria bacterium]|nr:hypothetical protein [Betaproteobacteria bacterium]
MKKFVLIALTALLTACGSPLDYTLAESNEPEKARKILEALSPEDQQALNTFVMNRAASGKGLDYKMTIREAIKAEKAEAPQRAEARAAELAKAEAEAEAARKEWVETQEKMRRMR